MGKYPYNFTFQCYRYRPRTVSVERDTHAIHRDSLKTLKPLIKEATNLFYASMYKRSDFLMWSGRCCIDIDSVRTADTFKKTPTCKPWGSTRMNKLAGCLDSYCCSGAMEGRFCEEVDRPHHHNIS